MNANLRRGRAPAAPNPELHYSLTSQATAAHGSSSRYLRFNLTRLGIILEWASTSTSESRIIAARPACPLRMAPVGHGRGGGPGNRA